MQHELLVDVPTQELLLIINGNVDKKYPIATALNGVGEQIDSERTPTGLHLIRAKIGHGADANTVFAGRRPTGEMYSQELSNSFPGRDWILTRIMWLSGLEKGKNRLGNCDTMRRYIYIHGSPDSKPMGIPSSRGCINMRNDQIIELFDQVPIFTKVLIKG